MLDWKVKQPVDLIFRQLATYAVHQGFNQYVKDLADALGEAHKVARENLKNSHQTMKNYYDLRLMEFQYNVGDLVYRLDTATIKGKSRKLSPVLRGPGVIVGKITPYLYRVQERKMTFNVNHDILKLCNDRDIPKRALQLAKKVKQREQKSDDNLSKALLFILRHGALKLQYSLLPGRFLHVEDILQRQGDLKNVTLEDVMRVVQAVNKQRLSLKIDAGSQMYKIRANHWHSMHVEDFDLEPLLRASDCTYAVHETQLVVLESILKKGLSRMGRNHIHLITGDIDELKKSKEVLIYLDVQKALDGGYSFSDPGTGLSYVQVITMG